MSRQRGLAESLLRGDEPDGTLNLDTTRPPQRSPDGPTATVYLTNGTRTSAGPGPGPLTLPAAEAAALVRARLAVYGDRPPGMPEPEPAARPFTDQIYPYPPRAGTRAG